MGTISLSEVNGVYILVGTKDFELVRMFDSMVYEDEVTDDLSISLQTKGQLDAAQSRQVMYLKLNMQCDIIFALMH